MVLGAGLRLCAGGFGLRGNSLFRLPCGEPTHFLCLAKESKQRKATRVRRKPLANLPRPPRPSELASFGRSNSGRASSAAGANSRGAAHGRERPNRRYAVGLAYAKSLALLSPCVRPASWPNIATRSEARRGVLTLPYAAPRGLAERAEKRAPCLSIAVRRCELGPGRSFSQPARGC